ncbi:glycosyltransferase family 25 protein [Aeromonas veronii]|uniref:glycosyltransferase family 25 protein n=1 Tax=Aeromonas veronii TaxID=654 RepID=UPI0011A0E190|nr:glycosyltransferase family 25 protein [Aeromonas veronii]
MKIFIVSLKNAESRRERVKRVLAELDVEFEFFDAINGFAGLPERLQGCPDDMHRKLLRSRPLTPGEKGCYASHYLLWEKCIELNEPIIVLEDDFLPTRYFCDIFEALPKLHEKYEYLKLEPQIGDATALEYEHGIQTMLWHNNVRWTTGYSINPNGARKLVGCSSRWLCSVDNFIGESYRHKVQSVGVLPYAIYSPGDMESGIQNKVALAKVPLLFKASREIYRFYRFVRMYFWNKKYKNQKG